MKALFKFRTLLLALLVSVMFGCTEDLTLQIPKVTGPPHDPSKPIEVTDVEPKVGTAGQKMLIYGSNFGADPKLIRVSIGGTEAVVISSNGSVIYCLVPMKSATDDFDGFKDEDEDEDDEDVNEDEDEDEDEESASTPKSQDPDDEDTSDNERTVHVAVGAHGYLQEASLDQPFIYKRDWKVRTLAGKVNEKLENEFHVSKIPEPFSDCGNFPQADNFVIDPVNDNLMWVSCDNGGGIRMFDMVNETVTFFATAQDLGARNNRVRNIDFTQDGNHHMIVSTDQFSDSDPTIFLVKRSSPTDSGIEAFTRNGRIDSYPLIASYACNGVAIHPVSNSIFFNKFSTGEMYKFPNHKFNPDLQNDRFGVYHWVDMGITVRSVDTEKCEMQFGWGEPNYEMVSCMHPTGKFMYVLACNYSFISKTFYNATEDTFGLPVWFVSSSPWAGLGADDGYVDDIGMNARIADPWDGVFVKNPAYEGQEDEYDFYFTDRENHCIRKVNPQGIVSTFAGRGRSNEGDAFGYADGLARGEAMFNRPYGIAYSPSRNTFYIGDTNNKRIREIYYE